MPPQTVAAIVLLGWMERDAATRYLRDECVFDPPMTEEQAKNLWAQYRNAVEALPERDIRAPGRLLLSDAEAEGCGRFLAFHRQRGRLSPILDVVKVNPMGLVAWQNYVVLDRAQAYMEHADARTWGVRTCLALPGPGGNIRLRCGLNNVTAEIPHSEFCFTYVPNSGFQIMEHARHVSITAFHDRMLLFSGYHRSYARMASANPEGRERSLLAALTTDGEFLVSPDSPNQGLRAMLYGPRPPLFADFFDERFFIRVKLRKRRFELRIQAQVMAIDEE